MITNDHIRFILAFLFVVICIILLIQCRQSFTNTTQIRENFINYCLQQNNNQLSKNYCDPTNNMWIISQSKNEGSIRFKGTNQ